MDYRENNLSGRTSKKNEAREEEAWGACFLVLEVRKIKHSRAPVKERGGGGRGKTFRTLPKAIEDKRDTRPTDLIQQGVPRTSAIHRGETLRWGERITRKGIERASDAQSTRPVENVGRKDRVGVEEIQQKRPEETAGE